MVRACKYSAQYLAGPGLDMLMWIRAAARDSEKAHTASNTILPILHPTP